LARRLPSNDLPFAISDLQDTFEQIGSTFLNPRQLGRKSYDDLWRLDARQCLARTSNEA